MISLLLTSLLHFRLIRITFTMLTIMLQLLHLLTCLMLVPARPLDGDSTIQSPVPLLRFEKAAILDFQTSVLKDIDNVLQLQPLAAGQLRTEHTELRNRISSAAGSLAEAADVLTQTLGATIRAPPPHQRTPRSLLNWLNIATEDEMKVNEEKIHLLDAAFRSRDERVSFLAQQQNLEAAALELLRAEANNVSAEFQRRTLDIQAWLTSNEILTLMSDLQQQAAALSQALLSGHLLLPHSSHVLDSFELLSASILSNRSISFILVHTKFSPIVNTMHIFQNCCSYELTPNSFVKTPCHSPTKPSFFTPRFPTPRAACHPSASDLEYSTQCPRPTCNFFPTCKTVECTIQPENVKIGFNISAHDDPINLHTQMDAITTPRPLQIINHPFHIPISPYIPPSQPLDVYAAQQSVARTALVLSITACCLSSIFAFTGMIMVLRARKNDVKMEAVAAALVSGSRNPPPLPAGQGTYMKLLKSVHDQFLDESNQPESSPK